MSEHAEKSILPIQLATELTVAWLASSDLMDWMASATA
jgi:hypothetical protein